MTELRTQSLPTGQAGTEHRQRKFFYFVFISLCSVFFSLEVCAEPKVPENFTYYVFWSGIRAGKATLGFENTPKGIIIQSRVTSASFISIFYRVDDVATSMLYSDGYPRNYTLKIREGRHRRHKVTDFAMKPEDGPQKVIYNNKLDNETVEFSLEKQVFDPLSGLYEIRKRQLEVGRSEYLDIFDSKKLWNVEIEVLRKERVKVMGKEFDAIVIKPDLKSEGIFLKKGEVYIWLTDDEKKIPVMIKSKVKIGSIVVKLAEGEY